MGDNRYVSLAEVRDLLNAEAEKRELLPSQKAAMVHANTICPLSKEQADEMRAELLALGFMSEAEAYTLVDLLPKYSNDVRAVFSKSKVTLDAGMVQSILDIVGKYTF